jgi:S-(hydroxymethyl)glutathione dehydrogenase / alcohol dehydrogenase
LENTRKARAAVCRSFGAPLSVEEVLIAPPARDEVRIRIEACAICHSDVAYADGAWGGDLPAVFGHEACGVVEEVGAGVGSPATGQRVIVGLVRYSGACARCRDGEPALCTSSFGLDRQSPISSASGESIGQGLRCGAFAELVTVHSSQAVPILAEIPPTSACLIGCAVMTGLGAVENTAHVAPGTSVVVIGAGGVGLNAIQGAVIAGADPVVAVDVSASKLAAALAFGATHAIDATHADTVAEVRTLTGGGADFVVSTAGSANAVEQGLACARRGGSLVVVGMPPGGQLASFDAGLLAHDGKRILGSKLGSSRPHEFVPRIAALYATGVLKLDELVTATYPLERINEAMLAMRRGAAIRNVLMF